MAELREKYTYNINPFPTSVKSNGSGGLGGWESGDEDADMDDEDSVVTALGCLGPLGGLLAPELQRYQKHLKDKCPATNVLASQLNPSSPVVNHLLLGRRIRSAPRSSRTSAPGTPNTGLGLPTTLGG
ncbi:hypothetical protein CRUP_034968, partial [Coryphaenoides rupestris]